MEMDSPDCFFTIPTFAALIVGLVLLNIVEVCAVVLVARRRFMRKNDGITSSAAALPAKNGIPPNVYGGMPTNSTGVVPAATVVPAPYVGTLSGNRSSTSSMRGRRPGSIAETEEDHYDRLPL